MSSHCVSSQTCLNHMSLGNSGESENLRLRLVALLALYDLLPPSFDETTCLDFSLLPAFDAKMDPDSVVQSLTAIVRKLHMPNANVSFPLAQDTGK
ncbi:hypothetical protein Hypma_013056 [Hypsizygus marmoreus]|uniref:Uncharacterized protein n=1 Tax=Hypsizygus marmoreus TaxID=39966 RepID=A0A369JHT7_HYPMA|nr:hypothetical protein Hypma_013056 [Hypsizygus marmoreus]